MSNHDQCHQRFMRWTKTRPMKQIDVNEQPYLQRYYITSLLGYQVWLHRFLRFDGELHYHSHPWTAVSMVLCGNYREHRLDSNGRIKSTLRLPFPYSMPLLITRQRKHRIVWTMRNTWTLMIVGRKRHPYWHFYDQQGQITEQVESSTKDWWEGCAARMVDA